MRGSDPDDLSLPNKGAEWFLAFQLLLSLVLVYVNVLRILASTQRRN